MTGKGKLTQDKMAKIQNYYGRAIKDNVHDIDLMKKRIFAILFHPSSSDQHPKHTHCHPGESLGAFGNEQMPSQRRQGHIKSTRQFQLILVRSLGSLPPSFKG